MAGRQEIVPQSQITLTGAQPAGKSVGVGVKQRPRVPGGIADVATRPQHPVPSRPMATPVGAEPLVAAGTFQFGEDAGPQLSAGPGAPNSAAPTCTLAEAAVNAKENIVREALEERDPVRSLQILDRGYAAASSEVRKLIEQDDITRFVVAEAVKKATAALTDQAVIVIDKRGQRPAPQGRADHVIDQIYQLVHGFDKSFAGIVVNEAMPVIRNFYQSSQSQLYSRLPDDSVLGYDGVATLASLAEQIAGSPEGDAAIADFAAMKAWNGEAMFSASASGTGRAYAAAYGHLVQAQTGDSTFVRRSLAASSMTQLRRLQSVAAEHSDALGEHGAQMARIAADFAHFPAARFEKAMDAYQKSMDVDWQRKEAALRHTIVGDGKYLLQHMMALNNIAQENGLAAEMLDELRAIANDPKAIIAIAAALENDPDLITGDGLKHLAGLLETLKTRPAGQIEFLALRMINVIATTFLRRTVLEKLGALQPGDPAAAVKITEALDGLRNKWFAKILGWSEADLGQAVTLVNKAATGYAQNTMLLKTGSDPGGIARLDAAVTAEFTVGIDKLESRMVGFNGATMAGRMMKSLGVTMGIFIYALGSLEATMDLPDAVKVIRTADLFAFTAQRSCDLLVSFGLFTPESLVGRYAAAKLADVPGAGTVARAGGWVGAKLADVPVVGRLVNAGRLVKLATVPIAEAYLEIYALMEAAVAVKAAVAGEYVQAGISGVEAVGFGLTFARAFGAAEWMGPWGMVIAAAAARVQIIYDEAKAAHQDEEKIKICLKAAGVESDRTAEVLSEQMSYKSSVSGRSQLPFLSEFALSRNRDVVEWINSFSNAQVDRLSNILQIELNNGQETPSQYRPQPVSPDVLASDKADAMNEFERKLILHGLIQYKPILQDQAKP